MRSLKHITSSQNPHFRALVKLVRSSRERRGTGHSLIEGIHLIEAYKDRLGPPEQIAVSKSASQTSEIHNLIKDIEGVETLVLNDVLFRTLSSLSTPVGVVAVIQTPGTTEVYSRTAPCVLLEDIRDPGNLGSILRSAAAAGVHEVYLSKGCAHCWAPRVLRAGMGAHFMVRVHENVDLVPFIQEFEGRVIAASPHASRSIFSTDLTGSVGLLFGNEGAGLSNAVLSAVKFAAHIPMPGATESLNAAAAAAVCLFERVRQIAAKENRA